MKLVFTRSLSSAEPHAVTNEEVLEFLKDKVEEYKAKVAKDKVKVSNMKAEHVIGALHKTNDALDAALSSIVKIHDLTNKIDDLKATQPEKIERAEKLEERLEATLIEMLKLDETLGLPPFQTAIFKRELKTFYELRKSLREWKARKASIGGTDEYIDPEDDGKYGAYEEHGELDTDSSDDVNEFLDLLQCATSFFKDPNAPTDEEADAMMRMIEGDDYDADDVDEEEDEEPCGRCNCGCDSC